MNKTTLRLLLLTGLAVFIYASCSKDKDFLDVPDSFERNKNPFSVEAVPQEGCDKLIFFRIKGNDSIKTQFYPTDTTLKFKVGDSIILEARAKNGYTFTNWVRDGNGVSDNPIYGFKLDSLDIDKSTHFVKHHYEARFGLDYALQVIPPIDSVIPAELIAAMGPFLHFGDNPPRIDTCFRARIKKEEIENRPGDSIVVQYPIRRARFIHNLDDPTTTYFRSDSTMSNDQQIIIRFSGQHRCVAESALFIHDWGKQLLPSSSGGYEYHSFFEECKTNDSIFIMGKGNEFTAYFCHTAKKRFKPYNEWADINVTDFNLIREEWVIISGELTTEGISECRIGTCVKGYSEPSQSIGVSNPAIHDILIYDFPPTQNSLYDFPHYSRYDSSH